MEKYRRCVSVFTQTQWRVLGLSPDWELSQTQTRAVKWRFMAAARTQNNSVMGTVECARLRTRSLTSTVFPDSLQHASP